MTSAEISGLYAVTPDIADTVALVAKTRAALTGGARYVQYRNKTATATLRLAQARALKTLCDEFAACLIVNDHLDLALAVDAHGVHLGAEDGSIAAARARLGGAKLLGASCYNGLDAAHAAESAGADYCAFGSFFPSTVKPSAVRADTDLLRRAKRELKRPIAAIGGITLANAGALIAAGADSVAVISALFDAPDVGDAARQFCALFSEKSDE